MSFDVIFTPSGRCNNPIGGSLEREAELARQCVTLKTPIYPKVEGSPNIDS